MWAKLKLCTPSKSQFSNAMVHGSGEESAAKHISIADPYLGNLRSSPNDVDVDEEYIKALHTKSFVDMYSRVHDQLNLKRSSTTISTSRNLEQAADDEEEDEEERMMMTELKRAHSSHLSYHYCEDGIPNFMSRISPSTLGCFPLHLNKLLLDFFDTTHQASTACASLLFSIDRARSHHRSVHLLLHNHLSSAYPSTFTTLSSHLEQENPLSPKTLSHFHLIHSRYPTLLRRLNFTYRKIGRRLKLIKFIKRGSGMSLITLLSATMVAAIVSASHGATVAVAATPAAATGDKCRLRRRGRWFNGWLTLEGSKARVDDAAKGAYIVGRDFDTLNQMLSRVNDEIEHGRDVARMVVRNREEGTVMRDVVKEMEGRRGEVGLGFEEQLDELEEHVYLCLVSINRSMLLVAREMTELPYASEVL